MQKSASEASPKHLCRDGSPTVPGEPSSSGWNQLALLGHSAIVVRPQLVIDGPSGSVVASVTVEAFWTEETIAIEVRPAFKFPQDLHLALLWLEERMISYSNAVSPF